MRYDYTCSSCNTQFELSCPIEDRNKAEGMPCPHCNSINTVTRDIGMLAITHDGVKTLQQRAGTEFNDILKAIKKKHPEKLRDGRKNSINV